MKRSEWSAADAVDGFVDNAKFSSMTPDAATDYDNHNSRGSYQILLNDKDRQVGYLA